MKFFKNIFLFVLIAAVSGVFTGCGKAYKKECIYFNLSAVPDTLDPQTAKDDNELLIIRNIYEGLLRKDKNGKIVSGAAESYEKQGLTYTFHLRKDSQYYDGTKLTAADFEFALKRAVLPETKAPFADRLKNIKNASLILSGKKSSDELGVSVKDERTLTVTLEEEDEYFLDTLTTSVCMPCNEKFFKESKGKYGLERKYTLSNGSYFVGKWNSEDFGIRLYTNENYKGDFENMNASVFLSCNTEESISSLANSNAVDMGFIETSEIKSAVSSGLSYKSAENKCIFLTIGKEYDQNCAKAFSYATGESVYKNALTSPVRKAVGIYPGALSLENAQIGQTSEYNIEKAKELLFNTVKGTENKAFPASTLYYFDDEIIKDISTLTVSHWQQNLSAFINIKPSDNYDQLKTELAALSLPFAIFPVKATGENIIEYLKNFGISDTSDYVSAQSNILKSGRIIPLAFDSTNIVYNKNITEFEFDSFNGYIDFSFVIKNGK